MAFQNVQNEDYEHQIENDRIIAHDILTALCDSTFSEEMEEYRDVIQDTFAIDNGTMGRVFSLAKMVELLRPINLPKRYFRGKRVYRKTQNQFGEPPSLDQLITVSEVVPEVVPEVKELPEEMENPTTTTLEDVPEHPSVAALISLLTNRNINTAGLKYDSNRYEKAIVVSGETKSIKDTLRDLNGVWKGKMKAWVFSKAKLLKLAQRETEHRRVVVGARVDRHEQREQSDRSAENSSDHSAESSDGD